MTLLESIQHLNRKSCKAYPRVFEDADCMTTHSAADMLMRDFAEYEKAGSVEEVNTAIIYLAIHTVHAALSSGTELQPNLSFPPREKSKGFVKTSVINEIAQACEELRKQQLCQKGLRRTLNNLYTIIIYAAWLNGFDLLEAVNTMNII